MLRLLCFFGFHSYERHVWAKIGDHELTMRICEHCNYSPTFER